MYIGIYLRSYVHMHYYGANAIALDRPKAERDLSYDNEN